MKDMVRIGGASGFWGDSSVGPDQLVASGAVDYIIFDYLAELTMSVLAAAQAKQPDAGYATDFVTIVLASILKDAKSKGIRLITNAGGINPRGCALAVEAMARELGVADLRVAIVEGDDVMPLLPELRAEGMREMLTDAPLPDHIVSANAYLGAFPIRDALAAGADVVITGRCVDSAMALGPLLHEFGWGPHDHDLLAAGSLAGHVIECGCQATGGLHTDWQSVPDWANIGYPIVECEPTGRFVVTKPQGTGGLVSPATVGEQILYEIADPASYVLPDVICDFRSVRMEQVGDDRVAVAGAKGRPGPSSYKVSSTFAKGYRSSTQLTIIGINAVAKARRTGEAVLERTSHLFAAKGLLPYSATNIEILGAESAYGPHSRAETTREAVLRLTVDHPDRRALEIFGREVAPAGTSWSPGTAGFGARPRPTRSIRQFTFLLDKRRLSPVVTVSGKTVATETVSTGQVLDPAPLPPMTALPTTGTETATVPLVALAYARSGDKGDTSNVGVMAREPEYVGILARELTPERVKQHLEHLVKGDVVRHELPGFGAFNFVMSEALDGGGMASLRNDTLGKGMAQIVLDMRIPVAPALAARLAA